MKDSGLNDRKSFLKESAPDLIINIILINHHFAAYVY